MKTVQPCPFCDSHNLKVLELDRNAWGVECLNCQAIGPIKSSTEEAAKAWERAHKKMREPV